MNYTVILMPDESGWLSVTVPSMPGCVSQGRTRAEALAHVHEAMEAWIEAEAEQGRGPLEETSERVLDAIAEALSIIDEMRDAGELPPGRGYALELAAIELRQSVAA